MKGLRRKVDNGELPPYRFVEINGLRLASPEHAYTVCLFNLFCYIVLHSFSSIELMNLKMNMFRVNGSVATAIRL